MTLPKIYITIDDGLDPTHSIEILSLLKKYEAKATFFWITQKAQELHDNNIALFSEILSLINTDGHEIGFHDPADYLPNLKSRIWSHFSFAEFTKGLEDLSKLTEASV